MEKSRAAKSSSLRFVWFTACMSCMMPDVKVVNTPGERSDNNTRTGEHSPDDAGEQEEGTRKPADSARETGDAAVTSKPESMPASASDATRCAPKLVASTSVQDAPSVHFLVDGSSSMNSAFGDGTRWNVLRKALVEPEGVIETLERNVKFGLTVYSNSDPMTCPQVAEVPPALMNIKALRDAYPMQEPGGGTPTGEALQWLIDKLSGTNNTTIILATDGEPNGCSMASACDWSQDFNKCLNALSTQLANAPATYESTFAAVETARSKHIPVWVVSMATAINSIPDLQKTANIGAGLDAAAVPGAQIYSPQSLTDLKDTLRSLVSSAAGDSCEFSLDGEFIPARACEGSVTLAGKKLECNSKDGWKAIDASHILLQGDACTRYKSQPLASLSLSFPCSAFKSR